MDLRRLFTVYKPFDHTEFLRGLERLEFQDPKWMYTGTETANEPLQGDIFPEIELHFTNSNGGAEIYIGPAMLVANSCDAVPGQDPAAAMAPVQEVATYLAQIQTQPDWKGRLDVLKRNRRTSRLYLPAVGQHPERYVDFTFISPVSTRRIYEMFAADRDTILRLSERGWFLLTGKLAHHFARGTRD